MSECLLCAIYIFLTSFLFVKKTDKRSKGTEERSFKKDFNKLQHCHTCVLRMVTGNEHTVPFTDLLGELIFGKETLSHTNRSTHLQRERGTLWEDEREANVQLTDGQVKR